MTEQEIRQYEYEQDLADAKQELRHYYSHYYEDLYKDKNEKMQREIEELQKKLAACSAALSLPETDPS